MHITNKIWISASTFKLKSNISWIILKIFLYNNTKLGKNFYNEIFWLPTISFEALYLCAQFFFGSLHSFGKSYFKKSMFICDQCSARMRKLKFKSSMLSKSWGVQPLESISLQCKRDFISWKIINLQLNLVSNCNIRMA